MRVAGQKNSGAWYRFNKFIKKYGGATGHLSGLATVIAALPSYAGYTSAIDALADAAGLSAMDTNTALAAQWMTEGIPLEVWEGRLEVDTYTKTTSGSGKVSYKPDHAAIARQFASELRPACILFKRTYYMLQDIRDIVPRTEGNPGGLPDATPGN